MNRRRLLRGSAAAVYLSATGARPPSAATPKLLPLYSAQVGVQRFAQNKFLEAIAQFAARQKFAMLQEQVLGSDVLWNVDLFRLDAYIKVTNVADRDTFDIYIYGSCFSFDATAMSPAAMVSELTHALAGVDGVVITKP